MPDSIIKLTNITKEIKGRTILKDINLEIQAKKITTIYGRSGSGKSTLLNIIGLLEKASSGKLEIFGKDAPKANSHSSRCLIKENINFIFQNFAILNDKSINYNLNIVRNKHVSKRVFSNQKESLLEKYLPNIDPKTKAGILSGGEQQRLAVVRALLKPASIILCDEPTGSLDPENKNLIFNALQDAKKIRKTIIIVSHDQEIIEQSDVKYDISALQKH